MLAMKTEATTAFLCFFMALWANPTTTRKRRRHHQQEKADS